MNKFKLTSTIVLLILHVLAYTQERILPFQNLSFQDGLSDNNVSTILQDSDGFIWLGTKLGIDKYDGQNIKTYFLPNENNQVNSLVQDHSGRLWATTTEGLYYFNIKSDQFERYISSHPSIDSSLQGYIPNVLVLQSGALWCTTTNNEIVSLFPYEDKADEIIKMPVEDGEENAGSATDLLQDNNGVIWIGTSNGKLYKYLDSKFTQTNFRGNEAHINSLSMDPYGLLWIGTNGNGLFSYHPKIQTTQHYATQVEELDKRISNNIVLDVMADRDNNIWIGTDGGGLILYESKNNRFITFKQNSYTNYPIADNSILSIHQGEDNVIWVGTVHGGASYFKYYATISHIPASDLAFDQIDEQSSQILEASNGDIWITAGRNGLRRYNPSSGKVTVFKDDPSKDNDLNGNNIVSLLQDNRDRIWIGTYNGGLNIYDPYNNRFLEAEDRFNSIAIFAMEQDSEGNVWVGTNNGIRVYNSDLKIVNHFNLDNTPNLNSNFITSLYEDIKGDMWVGTNLGLNVFKQNKVLSYISDKNNPNSLSGNRIRSITEDDDLSVLIGTYGHGLNRYHRTKDTFTRIGKKDGLEASIIGGIFLDKDKNIWCSTNLGLSKISPDGTTANFGLRHGIQAYSGGSAIISKDNQILMGGRLGLTYLNASEFKENNSDEPKKVFFTTATVVGENGTEEINLASNASKHITLSPQDKLLSIHFSSSDYWSPQNNKYAYKLVGLNNEWQTIGNQQVLTFSNLDPGKYSLMVKCADAISNEERSLASISITVLPSFWQKAWVRALIVLIGILLILLFIRWRISSIKKQQEQLELLVASKTKEVKAQQEKAYQSEIALLNVEKENQKLNQQKLREELNFKTEELTNYTLRTVHKNNLLTQIKDSLIHETKASTPKKGNLKKIVHLIDDSLILDEDWDNFYHLFNQIHTTFINSLKDYCPQLSDREIRLCALIKLNFTSQHIATLFGISLSSVKVARHRLRKKLNIAENQSYEDFFETLT
ncbi:ligand-binding sensor domain-containing protein [Arenibacter amylolyticus]|uniref:ligand-binding sensor domain-containing protein n=1 Tax=Arenibacter amylolyticus TaxID=1406873 RepID=UPI000A364E90|nr:two-component regulator propeller domain-containing protein [Arenibacter amylolyticus]